MVPIRTEQETNEEFREREGGKEGIALAGQVVWAGGMGEEWNQ